jgi:outer membrane lipoprotein carrier protein
MAFLLYVITLIFIAITASGDEILVDRIVEKVQANYEKANDFHASFTQEATVRALNKVEHGDGEVWFKKAGKMRWDYRKPNREYIISDGEKIWFYKPEEGQVIVSTLKEAVDTPEAASFLSGLGNLKEQFEAKFSEDSQIDEDGNYLIELTLKDEKEDESNKIKVAVDKKSYLINEVYLYDPFGNVTRLKFQDVKINGGIPDSLFNFEIPEGVDVIKAPSLTK